MNPKFNVYTKIDTKNAELVETFRVGGKFYNKLCEVYKGKTNYYAVAYVGNDDGDLYWVFEYPNRPSQDDVQRAYMAEKDKLDQI